MQIANAFGIIKFPDDMTIPQTATTPHDVKTNNPFYPNDLRHCGMHWLLCLAQMSAGISSPQRENLTYIRLTLRSGSDKAQSN